MNDHAHEILALLLYILAYDTQNLTAGRSAYDSISIVSRSSHGSSKFCGLFFDVPCGLVDVFFAHNRILANDSG